MLTCKGLGNKLVPSPSSPSTYKGEGPMSPSDKCVGSPVLPTPLHIMYPEVTTRGPGCCFGQPSLAAITGHTCAAGVSRIVWVGGPVHKVTGKQATHNHTHTHTHTQACAHTHKHTQRVDVEPSLQMQDANL